jgi:hypothetical protein
MNQRHVNFYCNLTYIKTSVLYLKNFPLSLYFLCNLSKYFNHFQLSLLSAWIFVVSLSCVTTMRLHSRNNCKENTSLMGSSLYIVLTFWYKRNSKITFLQIFIKSTGYIWHSQFLNPYLGHSLTTFQNTEFCLYERKICHTTFHL